MQQLYAKIKRTSKYAYQNDMAKDQPQLFGLPFKVNVLPSASEYCVQGGPGGKYRLQDVQLFVIDEAGRQLRIA
jgi:hypothetical protein